MKIQNRLAGVLVLALLADGVAQGQSKGFRIEEMTIQGLHRAIQNGDTTCKQVVEAYIERAKAYTACVQRL